MYKKVFITLLLIGISKAKVFAVFPENEENRETDKIMGGRSAERELKAEMRSTEDKELEASESNDMDAKVAPQLTLIQLVKLLAEVFQPPEFEQDHTTATPKDTVNASANCECSPLSTADCSCDTKLPKPYANEALFLVMDTQNVLPSVELVLKSMKDDFNLISKSPTLKAAEKAKNFNAMRKALTNVKKLVMKQEEEITVFEKRLKDEFEQAMCSQDVPVVIDNRFCRNGRWEFQLGWAVNYSGNWLSAKNYNTERLRIFGDIWKLQKAGGHFLSVQLPNCLECDRRIAASMVDPFIELLDVVSSVDKKIQFVVNYGDKPKWSLAFLGRLMLGIADHAGIHSIELATNYKLDISKSELNDTCVAPEKDLLFAKQLLTAAARLHAMGVRLVTLSFTGKEDIDEEGRQQAVDMYPEPIFPPFSAETSKPGLFQFEEARTRRMAPLLPMKPNKLDINAFSTSCLRYTGIETTEVSDFITLRDAADGSLIKRVEETFKRPVILHSDNAYPSAAIHASGVVVDMPFASEGEQLQRIDELNLWFSDKNIPVEENSQLA